MFGLLTVFRKELADHFSSRRFTILLVLVWLSGISAIYVAAQSLREATVGSEFVFLRLFTTSTGVLPPFIAFMAFFGPLVGLALGFDAINREQSGGTLGQVLSQPIFRDSVINGKFLAGMTTIGFLLASIVLVLSGLGLWMFGVPPSLEEAWRVIVYAGITIVYIGFWMALAMLFSIFFRRVTTSALAGIAVWMFFLIFMSMIAGLVADRIAPVDESEESLIRNEQLERTIMRVSPNTLYEEAIITMLQPTIRTLGPITIREIMDIVPGPLPLTQSLLIIWPHLVALIGFTLICFAISYVKFMRQEIRAP